MNRYKFARLYDKKGDLSKRWFVGYYHIHPETNKYSLFKIWISTTLRTRTARLKKARELINNIDNRLINGFNPFEQENLGFTKLTDALYNTLQFKATYTKPRTVQTYRSYINSFIIWLKLTNLENISIESFNYQLAQKFVDYLKIEKKVRNRTFNNYVEHCRAIFNDLVNREYILRNPFNKIKLLPEDERSVFAYTKTELDLLRYHFPKDAPKLWLVCQFVFYCAIRPAELVRLKIKYIDLDHGKIFIPAEISKTRRQAVINIPVPFSQDLEQLKLHKLDQEYFLFSKNLDPGIIPIAPTRIAEKFRKEAEKIGLKRKLYELKHTGAGMALEAGSDIRDIQLHLRHSDLNTTENYLKAFKSSTSEAFIKNFPKL